MKELKLRLKHQLTDKVAIGLGTIQVIEGALLAPKKPVKIVEVIDAAGLQFEQTAQLFLPSSTSSNGLAVDFAVQIIWRPTHIAKKADLHLRVYFDDESSETLPLGAFSLIQSAYTPIALQSQHDSQPFVVICMATYCPDTHSFQRQIESILLQTHKNWHLIISDDASKMDNWDQIEAICNLDKSRISLLKHRQNLGFYYNFERALGYVPENADFVAFADQDDLWYPEKLQSLLGTLQSTSAQCAYSDMRVVGEDGEVISLTYWQGRNNEYRDFDTVYLANTVTGAASLFKAQLLEKMLPFPAKIGDSFHDHWLACVSLASGRLAYADKPLYDYYQYGTSVIGHCDFKRWTIFQRVRSAMGLLKRLLNPMQFKQWLGGKLGGGIAIYRGECLRLRLMSQTILLRVDVDKPKLKTLNLISSNPLGSAMKLLLVHTKILALGKTTDDAEFRLAMGCLSRAYEARKLQKIAK